MSYEIPAADKAPGSLWYERTYGKLSEVQLALALAGQELHAAMKRLGAESVDATSLCKEILHGLPPHDSSDRRDPNSPAMAALGARLEAWGAEKLAARDGRGFVAKVPAFSIWRGSADPVHSYLAVDANNPLVINHDAVNNSLRRDYVTGAHLFSEEDQAGMRRAFDPQEEIADQLRVRPRRNDPQVTWAEFEANVGDLSSRLAAYPDITGVGGPGAAAPQPNQNN